MAVDEVEPHNFQGKFSVVVQVNCAMHGLGGTDVKCACLENQIMLKGALVRLNQMMLTGLKHGLAQRTHVFNVD